MNAPAAPTIGNLIVELQKLDPDLVITFDADEPPVDVDEVVELLTRPQHDYSALDAD